MLLKQLREAADGVGQDTLLSAFSHFSCKDKDVETFLKTKSLDFERRHKSRTYLVLDEAHLAHQRLRVLAYFTLALKVLEFDAKVSKSVIKNIDGFSKNASSVATILIGQFGKDEANQKAYRRKT